MFRRAVIVESPDVEVLAIQGNDLIQPSSTVYGSRQECFERVGELSESKESRWRWRSVLRWWIEVGRIVRLHLDSSSFTARETRLM